MIQGPATNQQLADIFGISKQKMHYNLTKLLKEGLIKMHPNISNNGKEVYYCASAQNYVLDLSLGEHVRESAVIGPQLILNILEQEYKLDLASIAKKILVDSLKLKSGQKLFLETGSFSLPLVEKLLIEAGKMNIKCTIAYHSKEMMLAKYEHYSLKAFRENYEDILKILQSHDVHLKLNPEVRYIQIKDPKKFKIRCEFLSLVQESIRQKKLKMGVIVGLLNDTLTDTSLDTSLQLWKALDVDYASLRKATLTIANQFQKDGQISIKGQNAELSATVADVKADCGSFDDDPLQSYIINYPSGEVLIIPKDGSINGSFKSKVAYVLGETVLNPVFEIKNSEIVSFSSETNQQLLSKTIQEGGPDGRKIALICLGTNPNVSISNIDISYSQKTKGLISLWWGNNVFFGGNVAGKKEWFVQLEDAVIEPT